MDISDTLAPNSDQLDAIELSSTGPRIFTVESVTKGNAEQPINVHLVEFPRPWRPGKTMRRVLAHCWGVQASEWVGRRVELFYDGRVSFGREKVGGTRISRLSHIDGEMEAPILVSQGRPGKYKVQPLPDAPTPEPPASRAQKAVDWFAAKGVTRANLEAHVGKAMDEWDDDDLTELKANSDAIGAEA